MAGVSAAFSSRMAGMTKIARMMTGHSRRRAARSRRRERSAPAV